MSVELNHAEIAAVRQRAMAVLAAQESMDYWDHPAAVQHEPECKASPQLDVLDVMYAYYE